MDLFQVKCILSEYGNATVCQKSIKRQEEEFRKFFEEIDAIVEGPFGKEKYMVVSCERYKLPDEEYKQEMNKCREKRRQRIKDVEPLTKDEFEKRYKALIAQIRKQKEKDKEDE